MSGGHRWGQTRVFQENLEPVADHQVRHEISGVEVHGNSAPAMRPGR